MGVLDLLKGVNVQEGLRELGKSAYSTRDNLVARVKTPVLGDGTDIWGTWPDSKDMNLYGGVYGDSRFRFKIDHDYDLNKIVKAEINYDGSISISDDVGEAGRIYTNSEGTEFIIIGKDKIKGAKSDYAIRSGNYKDITGQLKKGKVKLDELKGAGGFVINEWLNPDDIPEHDGWKELVVGKNKASEKDYAEASDFLREEYVPKAQDQGCFSDGTGMGFFVRTGEKDYKVRSLFVNNSNNRSSANDRDSFNGDGSFLRVLDKKSSEGATPKIDYNAALETVLNTDIKKERHAKALLNKVNDYYQSRN